MHTTTLAGIVCALPLLWLPAPCYCSTFKVIHTFTGGSDGANSTAGLVVRGHKLYGTTFYGGGTGNAGTIFSIDLTNGIESVVYSFIGLKDGKNPQAGLLEFGGALYGVTKNGGPYNAGEAFRFDPANATLTPLHDFGNPGSVDAAYPEVGLTEHKGQLFGTSINGGELDEGAIFVLDPKTGSENVLFDFGNGDYATPAGKLMEKDGLLFGVTDELTGSLFSLDPDSGAIKLLYSFNYLKEGTTPLAGVIADGQELLGTAGYGGGGFNQSGHGTVFSFNPKTKKPRALHVFHKGGHDGETPEAELLLKNGVVYGTTNAGGLYGKGTVFQLVLATRTETVLHDFTGNKDGGAPVASLVYDNGVLYGTTYNGGSSALANGTLNYGTVFAITP